MEIEPEIGPEWYPGRGPEPEIIRRGSRIRFRNRPLTNTNTKEGLHPCDLKLLPTFTYSSSDTHTLDDCAVCLSEFADGDEGRLLPNCNHTFHSRCIDEWFRSHSNCPLCRTPVQQPEPEEFVEPASPSVEPVPVEMEDERLRDSDDLTP